MKLQPGTLLGPYRLVELDRVIGEAEIWQAYQPLSGRPVSMRVFLRECRHRPGYLERFRREAAALTRLHHPNILPICDYGEHAGYTYLVTPTFRGLSLDHLLGEPWPLEETLLVIGPLASALDYAHARRVVHCDLRPTNVLVGDEGQVVLDGFQIGDDSAPSAPPGGIEPDADSRHPAPAQVGRVLPSPEGDRYAFGVIAFELLTGRPPFRHEVWPGEMQTPPGGPSPLPCSISSNLELDVVRILFRALSDDPKVRFPNARALARALIGAIPTDRDGEHTATEESQVQGQPVAPATPVAFASLASAAPLQPREPPGRARWLWAHRKQVASALMSALVLIGLLNLFVFQPAAAILAGRGGHAAAALPGGELLIAGGCTNAPSGPSAMSLIRNVRSVGARGLPPGMLDTAIVYSPPDRSWSAARRMLQARCDARALLLDLGQVLVVGGDIGQALPQVSAERYDRSANSWISAGKLRLPRRDYGLTSLANGQALVVGGTSLSGNNEPLASAERYDRAANGWSLTASLTQARSGHTATTLPNGQVLAAGGVGGQGTLAGAELWDPAGNSWSPAGSLQQARANHSATLLPNGQILVVGGTAERSKLVSVERFDLSGNAWRRVASLTEARAGHSATLLPDGKVLVVGGAGPGGELATAERYDPATNTWSPAGTLSRARAGHSATLLSTGQVLVVGGRSDADDRLFLDSVELYDPATNRWSAAPDLPL